LAQQFALARGQPGRCLDNDLDHEVAPAAALQHWHAGAALAQLLARLDAGRDVDRMSLAVEAGDLDCAAERGGGEADRRAGEQRGALALEHRVRLDVDEDVEVARRRAVRAGLALARQADAGAVVDPRGDFDRQRLDLVHPSLAAAGAARLLDDFAVAVAVGARLLDHEEALLRADLALPAAQLAAARRGTRLGARATARLAGDRNLDLDLAGAAVERVLELDLQVVAQVGSAARSRASTAEGAPENGLEDVAEAAEIRVRSAGAAPGEGGM